MAYPLASDFTHSRDANHETAQLDVYLCYMPKANKYVCYLNNVFDYCLKEISMNVTRRQFGGLALAAASTVAFGATPALAGARKGTFSGRKGYQASGTVKVKKKDGKTKVVLSDNFVFDPTNKNPPDIKIGFGNGEQYAKGSKIHNKLTKKKGASTFVVPAGIDTDKYNEVYVYCEKFSVILAVAKLK